jgi:hypothetical protein
MKVFPGSLNRVVMSTLGLLVVVVTVAVVPPSTVADAASQASTTRAAALHPEAHESISAGPSRAECLLPDVQGTSSLAYLQSLVSGFDTLTGTTVTCLSAYLDNAQTWWQWEHPWVTSSVDGYSSWVAQNPQVRQLVLETDLIPQGLKNVQDPMAWERACAAGRYDTYAKVLGRSLVAAGLQDSVIRLGSEMNGEWESDFIGTRVIEQKLWAKCFANEATGLRKAKGEHFLIDWNPNACAGSYPYRNFYPGNAYVNIVGIDLYDEDCLTPTTPVAFSQIVSEPYGLGHFEAFARTKGKPMSIPEWGLLEAFGDDPGYISGVGHAVNTNDFAFETYFDVSRSDIGTLPLGPTTPLSLAAFLQSFGST